MSKARQFLDIVTGYILLATLDGSTFIPSGLPFETYSTYGSGKVICRVYRRTHSEPSRACPVFQPVFTWPMRVINLRQLLEINIACISSLLQWTEAKLLVFFLYGFRTVTLRNAYDMYETSYYLDETLVYRQLYQMSTHGSFSSTLRFYTMYLTQASPCWPG